MRRCKILFVNANPERTSACAFDREVREAKAILRGAPGRDFCEIIFESAVRPIDLQRCLLDHKPRVVHMSTHGDKGGLLLEDDHGGMTVYSKEQFLGLFTYAGCAIELVVFNACDTFDLARAVSEVVGCAIGMNPGLDDEAAIEFSKFFYNAVGYGRSIKAAFELGKNGASSVKSIAPRRDLATGSVAASVQDTRPQLYHGSNVDPARIWLIEMPENIVPMLQERVRSLTEKLCNAEISEEYDLLCLLEDARRHLEEAVRASAGFHGLGPECQ